MIQAVWGLMDVRALRRYQFIRRNDFVAAIAAMIGVLALGPLYGLLVAVGLAVLGLVYRSSRAEMDIMGKVPDEKAAWGSICDHPERRTIDGILVVRLDAPLFWANASEIHDRVIATVDEHPGTQALLLDLEATSQLDTTSIDMLEQLLSRLHEQGIELYLVRVFYSARQVLAKAGFIDLLGEDHMWHSISAGVRAAKDVYGVGRPASLDGYARPIPDAADDDVVTDERIAVDHPQATTGATRYCPASRDPARAEKAARKAARPRRPEGGSRHRRGLGREMCAERPPDPRTAHIGRAPRMCAVRWVDAAFGARLGVAAVVGGLPARAWWLLASPGG